jgi:hypothetical protein
MNFGEILYSDSSGKLSYSKIISITQACRFIRTFLCLYCYISLIFNYRLECNEIHTYIRTWIHAYIYTCTHMLLYLILHISKYFKLLLDCNFAMTLI